MVSRLYLINDDEARAKPEMIKRPIQVLALILLVGVVVAQAHFCIESSAARSTRHQCQVCKSGGWAVAGPDASLNAQVASNPLQDEAGPCLAYFQPIETKFSRAPPRS